MIKRLFRNEAGFTMVEMMVVLIIIAVLIAGGIKFYLGYIENARVTKAKGQIATMQAALDAYYSERGSYPSTNAELFKASIRTTTVDNEIEAVDPWGGKNNYVYVVGSVNPGTNNAYVVRSGYNNVQKQTDTYVAGEGANGEIFRSAEVTKDKTADGADTK